MAQLTGKCPAQFKVCKKGKKNVFNGRILEMEGLPDLTVEQAFELTDAPPSARPRPPP
jgi:aconitase B